MYVVPLTRGTTSMHDSEFSVVRVDGELHEAFFYDLSIMAGKDFYKMPRWLLKVEGISTDAIMLYTILLDRLDLSRQNAGRYSDEHGRIYLIYTRRDLMSLLNWGRERIAAAFKNLSQAGILVEKRRGKGKPSLIYLLTI